MLFLEEYGHGFDKFAAAVTARTRPNGPRRKPASTLTTIRATAREFASHRPASIVHPARRVVWYGDDTQRSARRSRC